MWRRPICLLSRSPTPCQNFSCRRVRPGVRPDVRADVRAARVSSAAPKKKSFDRGGPVWPPQSNVTNNRLRGGHILLWRWVPLPFQTSGGDVACWPKTWPELNWLDLTWFSRIFDLILMAFWLQKCIIFTLSWQRWCSNFHGFLDPNFHGFWIDFWTRSENIDFVKILLPPAREHDFKVSRDLKSTKNQQNTDAK